MTEEGKRKRIMSPKLKDDELLCECGHVYHSHTRPYDPKRKVTAFAHVGPCTACDCTVYRFAQKFGRGRSR